jgi:hypothetical protein
MSVRKGWVTATKILSRHENDFCPERARGCSSFGLYSFLRRIALKGCCTSGLTVRFCCSQVLVV